MRTLTRSALLGAAIVVVSAGALADDRYRGDRYDRGPYAGRDRHGAALIDRVLYDLERARSYRWADGHERRHFEQAVRNLERFRSNWHRGRYDDDRLDDAIEHLDHLAHADQVHPRDRQILRRDVYALRDFRAGLRGRRGGRYF
jgi:hypothetical protein